MRSSYHVTKALMQAVNASIDLKFHDTHYRKEANGSLTGMVPDLAFNRIDIGGDCRMQNNTQITLIQNHIFKCNFWHSMRNFVGIGPCTHPRLYIEYSTNWRCIHIPITSAILHSQHFLSAVRIVGVALSHCISNDDHHCYLLYLQIFERGGGRSKGNCGFRNGRSDGHLSNWLRFVL